MHHKELHSSEKEELDEVEKPQSIRNTFSTSPTDVNGGSSKARDLTKDRPSFFFDEIAKDVESRQVKIKETGKPLEENDDELTDWDVKVHDKEQDDAIRREIHFEHELNLRSPVAQTLEDKIPRIYNIVLYIVIPLLAMVGTCFLFGFAMAKVESPGEIEANNELIRNYWNNVKYLSSIIPSVENTYQTCLEQFQDESSTTDNLLTFMDQCTKDGTKSQAEKLETFLNTDLRYLQSADLSYNWVTCKNETTGGTYSHDQGWSLWNEWVESYTVLRDTYLEEGLTEAEANTKAVSNADGSKNCSPNIYASAIFWHTIMTTIGYGNTAPVTGPGRSLVYIFGSFSIFLFCTIIANAGYIVLLIADDFFSRFKFKRLTEGFMAALFWLAMFILWLVGFAFYYVLVANSAYGKFGFEARVEDGFWFAFITVTTVGLGDIHIQPELTNASTTFSQVIVISIGMIFLANFWLKVSNLFMARMTSSGDALDGRMKSLRVINVDQ